MIFDWDDLTDKDGWFIQKLIDLKGYNPTFKCTVFAIPVKCSRSFLETIPDWVQLGVHGWIHESNYECKNWSYQETLDHISACKSTTLIKMGGIIYPMGICPYENVFKAPGWQISQEARKALMDSRWILADNPNYKKDRIPGERIYDWTEFGDKAWHGHVNSGAVGNGLMQTWDKVVDLVKNAKNFQTVSEVM